MTKRASGAKSARADKRPIQDAKAKNEPPLQDDPQVAEATRVFTAGDTAARVAFVQRCPDNPLKETVLEAVRTGYPEVQYMGLCMLADPYCRGLDTSLGIAIVQAVYAMSQRAFSETHSPTMLDTGAQAACTCLLGYSALGRHDDAVSFGRAASAWLDSESHIAKKAVLLMSRIEAHLNLGQFDEAEALLQAAEAIEIPPSEQADQRRLQDLRRVYDKIVQDAIKVRPVPESEAAKLAADREDLGEKIQYLKSLMNDQQGGPIQDFVSELAAQVDGSKTTSPTAWAIESQPLRDKLTEILSGGGGGMTELRNRNRLINAALIFGDPVKGRDPSVIEETLGVLLEALTWAKANNFPKDEADALWSMYLCYSRTERPAQAIEALQALRANLEARRMQISDPRERAGAMLEYPYLFPALCRLLCRAGRPAEALDAMEGAKGRFLSDVLTEARGQIVHDAQFRASAEDLARILGPLGAHYLSYFVDDDETYAALVAKDGSVHCHTIPIGRGMLRSLVNSTDPKTWGRSQSGFFSAQKTAALPAELSGLVQWLEPLVEAAILQPGDHLCYCPDDLLHLVPLHYLPLADSPIVKRFSISRIHSAAALLAILRRSAERPSQFVAMHVPAQQDLVDADKVSALSRVPGWLAEHSKGITLDRENATLEALAGLDLSDRVVHFATHGVFPQKDLAGQNPNPFYGSGLALAKDGTLPSVLLVAAGKADDTLLTPERALQHDFGGSHVTLQACVSGLAKEGIGGDALGLELALLLAGAQSLLTTHWNVSAAASADFAVRFYRKWLLEKATRAQAWQTAVFEVMGQEHPSGIPGEYYWAGFSLSGDFR